ncbi:hypothetical protein HanLR1_Chr00c1848g0822321 [Helianthus annuus]|nr:hypothetical protein HanLR1_Chr00c1848g0822321 [Helianthus annuus]
MQLILASLIHGFEFQNPSNEQIDMTESPGLTSQKATPLELLVAPRLLPHVYESWLRPLTSCYFKQKCRC